MKTLQIDEPTAKKFYPKAQDEFKATLEGTFGKQFFIEKPWEAVKTVDDACQVLGIDPDDVWHEADEADEVAYKQIKVVIKALNFLANGNKEWIPDYNNASQRKWMIWWYMNEPGFRLYDVRYGLSASTVGSRLVFLSEELARYAAAQFIGLFRDFYTLNPTVAGCSNSRLTVEQIKTFEDACKVKGYDPSKIVPNVSMYPQSHGKALVAIAKLFVVIEALNHIDNDHKDWKPDFNDSDEEKHSPWVDMEDEENNPTGFRLLGVGCDGSCSYVGSRLVYRTRKLAEYGFNQFQDLYRDLMVLG